VSEIRSEMIPEIAHWQQLNGEGKEKEQVAGVRAEEKLGQV
jgi:hypothetical protein